MANHSDDRLWPPITVSSDPQAFLRPIYRQVAADPSFAMVATEVKYARLVDAVAAQSEHHATLMRGYSPVARMALLGHLRKMEEQRAGPGLVQWTARKCARTLTCVALYLPHGVDLRLLEDDELRRTQLVQDGPHAEALAVEWREKSEAMGWRKPI